MWGDMHQINAPLFYYFYDLFKNQESIFYNFKSGLGMNFYGVFFFFLSSPVNFILLFFQRNDILYALSIILLIKMMLIAFTSFLFFNKYFKAHLFYKIVFSVLYAFSGYVLILHTNIMWLDSVYLFPILLITLKNLYDKNKVLGYIIVLTMTIIMCFYISYMVLFFIFFSSIPYLYFFIEKDKRGKKIFLLGIGTITALLLSSFVLFPTYLQIKASSRMGSNFLGTLINQNGFLLDKISFFFMGTIVYAIIIIVFKQIRRDKFVWFIISILFLTMIQIVFDAINKIWHTGSYAFFPLRYGFIPLFFILILGMHLLSYYKITPVKMPTRIKIYFALLVGIIITLFFLNYTQMTTGLAKMKFLKSGLEGVINFWVLFTIAVLLIGCFYIIFKYISKRHFIVLSSIILLEIMINGLFYIGIGVHEIENEYNEINKVYHTFYNLDKEDYRVKDLLYNNNASLIYDMNTNGHFTSLTNENQMEMMKKLGYSSYWMRTFDNGGTLFTDSLLSQKYVLVNHELDSSLYTLVNQIDENSYIYESKYTLPLGILMDQNLTQLQFDSNKIFDIQNHLYLNLMNRDSLIEVHENFSYTNIKTTKIDGKLFLKKIDPTVDAFASITIDATDNKILYLNILKDLNNDQNINSLFSFQILVNDQPFDLLIPKDRYIINHKTNPGANVFPQRFENGLLNLGRYQDTVTVKLQLIKDEVQLSEFSIGALDIEGFKEFINQYDEETSSTIDMDRNKIKVQVTVNQDDQILFLSIPYDTQWSATINGEKVTIEKVMGNFMAIKLPIGDHQIELTYIPVGLEKGIIVSLVTFILVLFGTIFRRKLDMNHAPLFNLIYIAFIGLYLLGIVLIYGLPILIEIISIFIRII